MGGHGLDLPDLGLAKMMASCEQHNEHLDSI